jgi:hypothetical protein
MARKKKQEDDAETSGVMDRLMVLLTLFAGWAKTGVPPGTKAPKSLNTARTWTAPAYGILVGIGSKRDITTTHLVYGKTVEKLAKLMEDLKPAKLTPKRVYKTAKAQKLAAEDTRDAYKIRLEGVAKQLVEIEYALEVSQRELGNERQRSRDLRADNDKLSETVARLTRDLALQGRGLKVVN